MDKKKIQMRTVMIVILALIPGIYVTIFLCAYYNPMKKIDQIPVAVVNQDRGGTIGDKEQNIGNKLVKNLKKSGKVHWYFVSEVKARKGVENQKYYGMLLIPKNFTKEIGTAVSDDKVKGDLEFQFNDKLGMMGSSIMTNISSNIEKNVTASISKNIVDNFTNGILKLPQGMEKLSLVLGKFEKGTEKMEKGAYMLQIGEKKSITGVSKLSNGLKNGAQGANKLSTATGIVASKSNQLSSGLKSSVEGLTTLAGYSDKYNNGIAAASVGIKKYVDASMIQLENSIKVMGLLKQYIAAHPESMKDSNVAEIVKMVSSRSGEQGNINLEETKKQLEGGIDKLCTSYQLLNGKIQMLPVKMKKAEAGSQKLTDVLNILSTKTGKLSSGIGEASSKTALLSEKSEMLVDGSQKLYHGIQTAHNGVSKMKKTIDTSLDNFKDKEKGFEGLGSYVSKPIDLKVVKVAKAKNTGVSFAPFIISLSLYLGGIIVMASLFSNKELCFEETFLSRKIGVDLGLFLYPLIGILQAVLVAFATISIIGIPVKYKLAFYLICVLSAFAYFTFVEVMNALLKGLGQVLCVILMVCQLTAGGGMMPVAILPPFYKAIHPYLPMTYTLTALRNTIQGVEKVSYQQSIYFLVVLSCSCILILLAYSALSHRNLKQRMAEV